MAELLWHNYKYYPYERLLGKREIETLFPEACAVASENGFRLRGELNNKQIERLVYFAATTEDGRVSHTMQSKLERVNGNGVNRQSTRYSAHGLHEYKGKFNPQIARAILNVLNVPRGARVVDPFCGSGTSLIECVHLGMRAVGTDINPLAVFIANAKLDAVRTPAAELRAGLTAALKQLKRASPTKRATNTPRLEYLRAWFENDVLDAIEYVRHALEVGHPTTKAPLLTVASNLLRDYSLQDPNDLRIRRRKSPLPAIPFAEAFEAAALQFLAKLEDAQSIVKPRADDTSRAVLTDSRNLSASHLRVASARFDCALTSPPYATALPYIDTQRLSLVWLNLIPPSQIQPLDARLVGSRELRGSKRELMEKLRANDAQLPKAEAEYCLELQAALSSKDGFRRQAVPLLLYRYFAGMADTFKSLRPLMKDGAPFALIVGSNHTILSGKRFDIDTPQHLANIASHCGWRHEETIPLQTYQRFGYHMSNAVIDEGLVIVRAA